MNAVSFGLAMSGVVLNAAAQLLLKAGTNALKPLVVPNEPILTVWRLITQPFLLGGVTCCVLGLGVWVVVLSKVPVSVAYPLLSVGYVLNAFLAYFLFKEALTPTKLIGVAVIMVGVLLITRPVAVRDIVPAGAGDRPAHVQGVLAEDHR